MFKKLRAEDQAEIQRVVESEANLRTMFEQVSAEDQADIKRLLESESALKATNKTLMRQFEDLEAKYANLTGRGFLLPIHLTMDDFELKRIHGNAFIDLQDFIKQTIIDAF